jgi:HlyD family secretion protein
MPQNRLTADQITYMTRILTSKLSIVVLLIIAGAAAVFLFARNRSAVSNQYFTSAVEKGSLRNAVNATGVVQTVITVQVGSQVSGQIEELYADFNSIVKRGQLLARLDSRNLQAQVENSRANVAGAQARVRSAEAELKTQAANLQSSKANLEVARVARDNTAVLFKRASELAEGGVASKNDFDNAKANADSAQAKYEQAQAAVAQTEAQSNASAAQVEQANAQLQQAVADLNSAELNLGYCNIYSPVDGVVISRNVDVGQTIAASLQSPTLFSIANDLSHMQVNANIDEADIGNISDQADVKFTVDAYPNDLFRGRISEIRLNPQTVQNVVTYSVILNIDNPEMKLKPGMTANITITVDQRENVLKVPNAALRYTPPGRRTEEFRPEPVPTALSSDNAIEASSQTSSAKEVANNLAPGQKWDPSQKIKFVPPKRTVQRQGVVFVLDPQGNPQPKEVVVGITDGSATELISGDLKPGDTVVIGDSTQAANVAPQAGGFGPFGFGGRGGGGRGGP